MNSATAQRISPQSVVRVNPRNRVQMNRRLEYYQQHKEEIGRRLAELDREWDIDRTVNANLSLLAFTGMLKSLEVGRKPLFLTAGCIALQLQHAIQGSSPPARLFRRMGFRTAAEIEEERHSLRELRGDFGTMDVASGETGTSR